MKKHSEHLLELHCQANSIPPINESAAVPHSLLYLDNACFEPSRRILGAMTEEQRTAYLDELENLRRGPRDEDGEFVLPEPPRIPTGFPLEEFLRFMATDPVDPWQEGDWSGVLSRYTRFHDRLLAGGDGRVGTPTLRALVGPTVRLPGVRRPWIADLQGRLSRAEPEVPSPSIVFCLRRQHSGKFYTSCNINGLVYFVRYERQMVEEMIREAEAVMVGRT
ncbi:MAG: hypothetical protein RLY93_05480 [Sumerlaeia bacterium]